MLSSIAIFLLALSWVIAEHFPPWFTFHTEAPSFAASIFGILACYFHSQKTIDVPQAVGICFALICVAILQRLTGLLHYTGDVWVTSTYLILFATGWFWGYCWKKASSSLYVVKILAIMFVFVGLATTLQLLAQWLGVEQEFAGWILEKIPQGRPRANIGQPNQAATTIVLAMISAAVLYTQKQINLVTLCSLVLLLILAVTVTQSRTALLSILTVFSIFLLLTRKNPNFTKTRFAVLLWVVLCFFAAWSFAAIGWGESSATIGMQQMTSSGSRPLIWRQLIVAIAERPWFGWGWLQIPAAQQAGAINYPGSEQTNYAHNIIIDALVMLGIPLTFALITILIKALISRTAVANASMDAKWAAAMTVPIVVHAMLELPHAYAYFILPVSLMFGVFDASTEKITQKAIKLSRSFLLLFVILWGLILATFGYEYMLAEEDFRINRFENRRIGERDPGYSIPNLYMLTQFEDLFKAMRLRAVPNMSATDIDLLIAVSKRYSWAALQFRTAVALGLNGMPEEATRVLRVIQSIFPADVYEEAKTNYKNLADEKYPILRQVQLP